MLYNCAGKAKKYMYVQKLPYRPYTYGLRGLLFNKTRYLVTHLHLL